MSWLVIGNPIAGGGRGERGIAALERALRARGLAVETFLTRNGGDARRRAGELAPDVQGIAVVGGDGTINEVLNGLADPSRLLLAQLPLGTANILAHELRLPRSAAGVAEAIRRGRVQRMDMGVIAGAGEEGRREKGEGRRENGDARVSPDAPAPASRLPSPFSPLRAPPPPRRFLLVASAGFDAMVTRDLLEHRRGALGYKGYVRPILRTLRHYRDPALSVSLDGGPPLPAALAVVSKVRNYGGLLAVTDRAACDSGHLDVCLFPRVTPRTLARYMWAAWRGRVSALPEVTYRTATRVRLDAVVPTAVQVDGDYYGTTPVELTLQPAAVGVVVP